MYYEVSITANGLLEAFFGLTDGSDCLAPLVHARQGKMGEGQAPTEHTSQHYYTHHIYVHVRHSQKCTWPALESFTILSSISLLPGAFHEHSHHPHTHSTTSLGCVAV